MFSSKLIAELPPLPENQVYSDTFSATTCWYHTDTLSGGSIGLTLTQKVAADGVASAGYGELITSGLDTNQLKDTRNPRECVTALFTLVAAANETTLESGRQLTHIVRANRNSRPFFEKLRAKGIYGYCDLTGERIDLPTTINEYGLSGFKPIIVGEYTLFGCALPNKELDVLAKFTPIKLVQKFVKIVTSKP